MVKDVITGTKSNSNTSDKMNEAENNQLHNITECVAMTDPRNDLTPTFVVATKLAHDQIRRFVEHYDYILSFSII